ncbi:hypothetical protein SBA3_1980002 [Candidatus Sulfopaludibacter sp. SbA3]|nr:hypothetical protein SBA3_1980002 [Candidatus Sulfopaludibacter sp. SbA3]
MRERSDADYVFGLKTLGTLLDLELHLGAFIQAAIATGLDRGKVNEHIVAARSLDESIAFSGIKPFHNTFFLHYTFSYYMFVAPLGFPDTERTNFRGLTKNSGGRQTALLHCVGYSLRWHMYGQAQAGG